MILKCLTDLSVMTSAASVAEYLNIYVLSDKLWHKSHFVLKTSITLTDGLFAVLRHQD